MVPAHLIELGQQALATVTTNVAGGAPLVRCQLLASEFYEALKRELRATSELGVVERAMVAAATGLCRHAATASITPDTMLAELRRAISTWRVRMLVRTQGRDSFENIKKIPPNSWHYTFAPMLPPHEQNQWLTSCQPAQTVEDRSKSISSSSV